MKSRPFQPNLRVLVAAMSVLLVFGRFGRRCLSGTGPIVGARRLERELRCHLPPRYGRLRCTWEANAGRPRQVPARAEAIRSGTS